MIDKVLDIIAPHYCCGCGKVGSLLCQYCEYNIIDDYGARCLHCDEICSSSGICRSCSKRSVISRAWMIGHRDTALKELIDRYKFENAKVAHQRLASLLDARLSVLPSDTCIIGVPTISSHIRMRGYDHIKLVAKQFARLRSLHYSPLLLRRTNSVQRGASAAVRRKQAAEAFMCSTSLDPGRPYLIIDDVITTGATLRSAADCLREAGAVNIWVAAIARQPLDW